MIGRVSESESGVSWQGTKLEVEENCYCAWTAQFCANLQTLSSAMRTSTSKPALSSAFLLEFVGIKLPLSLLKNDLK